MFARLAGRRAAAAVGASGLGMVAAFRVRPNLCHGGHKHTGDHTMEEKMAVMEARLANMEAMISRDGWNTTTGKGDAVFVWDQQLTAAFPDEARGFEVGMHGGFNEDAKTGIVYTGIPGYGLCSISADLKTWTKVGTDSRLKDNIHGIDVFEHKGQTLIAVAQNNNQRVLILGLDGTVKQEINKPKGGEFNSVEANAYYSANRYADGNIFACTDVTFLDGRLYVSTGYCAGDFILTLEHDAAKGAWVWGKTAWGGKGTAAGQFTTAHGVTAHDGHIYVANREAHQVVKFTSEGKLVEVMPDIPAGSRICNTAHAEHNGYFVMNALAPLPTDGRGPPIYAHTGDRLVATLDPASLGIPMLKHLHHTWPHYTTDGHGGRQLYLLVHGWRNGKFAVLKHLPPSKL